MKSNEKARILHFQAEVLFKASEELMRQCHTLRQKAERETHVPNPGATVKHVGTGKLGVVKENMSSGDRFVDHHTDAGLRARCPWLEYDIIEDGGPDNEEVLRKMLAAEMSGDGEGDVELEIHRKGSL